MANTNLSRAVKLALVAASFSGAAAVAQDQAELEQVVVTGTRITLPGVESSSPIFSVGAAEIQILQQPEVEKIVRILPISAPSDGQNANNGTAGAATINLRGLGAQRNLILMDGKRLTPYNFNGLVDTSIIPTALVERLDIITGGASAVYGSDAISGALNFVMKKDFEGAELNTDWSFTEIVQALEAQLDREEKRCLWLMLEGVRDNARYVEVLDLAEMDEADQRAEVKRVKDRLAKKLQRFGASIRTR